MPLLHMETDLVRGVGSQLQQAASSLQQQTQQLTYSVQALSSAWQGPSADIFANEIQPILQRLNQTALEGDTLNQRLQREVDEWERISSLFGAISGLGSYIINSVEPGISSRYPNGSDVSQVEIAPIDLQREFANFTTPNADKDGMATVPDEQIANLFGLTPRSVTMTEKRLIDDLNIFEQKKLYDIQKEAYAMAEKFSGPNGGQEDGLGDAYRHAYWNALMTREFGADWAKKFSDAHEAVPDNPKSKAFMDLWNNQIGIKVAQENPGLSKQELANKIAEAVRNGEMVIIDGVTQQPIFSNQATGVENLPNPNASST